MVDVIGTRSDFERPLRAAAELYDLDAEALIGKDIYQLPFGKPVG